MLNYDNFDYELLDCGDDGKIEKFGETITDRPCSQAEWDRKIHDIKVDAFFQNEIGIKNSWKLDKEKFPGKFNPENSPTWNLQINEITAELKFSSGGQVGIYPEQFDNWIWVQNLVKKNANRELKILNTFAYTGLATLFASDKNTEVCHLDSAKSAINWAKRNAKLSKLENNKIRWICDDVMKFMQREVSRGKKYDGIILDPPSFGRAAGKNWKIEENLDEMMSLVRKLLTAEPLFVILTCHTPDIFSPTYFANILDSLGKFPGKKAEELNLNIPSKTGNSLAPSFGARICN